MVTSPLRTQVDRSVRTYFHGCLTFSDDAAQIATQRQPRKNVVTFFRKDGRNTLFVQWMRLSDRYQRQAVSRVWVNGRYETVRTVTYYELKENATNPVIVL